MINRLNKLMKAMRADISALLVIAFVFQFVTPVVVLASDNTELSEFETAMRASICRVDLSEGGKQDGRLSHTDSFVCDFCVLCSTDTRTDIDHFLPEIMGFDFHDGRPQPATAIEYGHVLLSQNISPQSPRAPPAK